MADFRFNPPPGWPPPPSSEWTPPTGWVPDPAWPPPPPGWQWWLPAETARTRRRLIAGPMPWPGWQKAALAAGALVVIGGVGSSLGGSTGNSSGPPPVTHTITVTEPVIPVTSPRPSSDGRSTGAPSSSNATSSSATSLPATQAPQLLDQPQTPSATAVDETPVPMPSSTVSVVRRFANCAEARAAGVAPIRRGEPGYSSALDRDGDGIACE